MKLNVLYEDNHLIAVEKPAGVLTQGDETGDVSLMDEVKKYLKEKYQKPGNVFLGLLHRLDRPVSGIILFAKTSKGASRLSEQFRNHSIVKIYHAVVVGKPGQNRGVLINYLDKDEKNKRAVILDNNLGQEAELYYEVVASNDKYSLLKIKLETGRFHQIRVQLANAGCPILGDLKYGAIFSLPDKNLALAATDFSFETATTGDQINLSIPLPTEWEKYVKE
jgi:23S rRNA pseudouridine1911/1915/1917 synthase